MSKRFVTSILVIVSSAGLTSLFPIGDGNLPGISGMIFQAIAFLILCGVGVSAGWMGSRTLTVIGILIFVIIITFNINPIKKLIYLDEYQREKLVLNEENNMDEIYKTCLELNQKFTPSNNLNSQIKEWWNPLKRSWYEFRYIDLEFYMFFLNEDEDDIYGTSYCNVTATSPILFYEFLKNSPSGKITLCDDKSFTNICTK